MNNKEYPFQLFIYPRSSNVHGSFWVKNEEGVILFSSRGYTLKKRYISIKSHLKEKYYSVYETEGNLHVMLDAEKTNVCMMKTYLFKKNLDLLTIHNDAYIFQFVNRQKFSVLHETENIGILQVKAIIKNGIRHQFVELTLKVDDNLTYIITGAIILIFRKNSMLGWV